MLATIAGSIPEPPRAAASVCTPKFWMPVANFSPRSKPTCANVVLHDTMKLVEQRSAALLVAEVVRASTPFVCGSGIWSTTGNFLSTSTLFCSAIDAVTVLNVEPGGYSSRHARASSGLSGAFVRNAYAACAFFGSWLTSRFGSNVGFEYAASTPPVCHVEHDDAAALALQRERGRALRQLRQREHDGADGLLVRERVGEVADSCRSNVRPSSSDDVRALDADGTVLDRLVADDVGEERRGVGRVDALVLELVVRRRSTARRTTPSAVSIGPRSRRMLAKNLRGLPDAFASRLLRPTCR